MDNSAIKLYNGPVGRFPGKTTSKIKVFNNATEKPVLGPTTRKAATMGISHNV